MTELAGPLISTPCGGLRGSIQAPGDKSISHRALIFGALSEGETTITGLLEGDDVLRTAAAMRALGADVEREGKLWRVIGAHWRKPDSAIYFGNAGTGVRLVMGAVAGAGVEAVFDGDISLRARPMGRVLEPLRHMGLEATDNNGRLPVALGATKSLSAVSCRLATPSAQVKSAVLLAALGADGETQIHEPQLTRDHTERLLGVFGAKLALKDDGEGGRFITLQGRQKLTGTNINVPGDPSSAAFAIAAAVITPGSDVLVSNVLMNAQRIGFYQSLKEMGADISFENRRLESGEDVADIRARYSNLHGVEVPAERAPSMIDEYPILAVLAAFASGETKMNGLEELRVKESDRIASVEAGLAANGADVKSGDDWMLVRGDGGAPPGGGVVKTNHDHRIAMSFLVMGAASKKPIEIDDGAMVATSYPGFFRHMEKLGAAIAAA